MKPYVPEKLPIASVKWEPLIPVLGRANRALALYSGILQGLRNSDILLSPLTTKEAVLSSKIEGTRATFGEVLKHDAGEDPEDESKRRDIQEILNYRTALREAENALKDRPFTLGLLKQLHSILLDSVRGRDKARGQFRKTQNWIGLEGGKIEKAVFVPPNPLLLDDSLSNWVNYYHQDQPDPLIQLAIVHAQFEILHPFLDGNGRLGRMLIPLFLYERKVLPHPTFYLSEYLDEHRDAYVMGLRGLSHDGRDWNRWIEFFLTGLEWQAKENAKKAQDILRLYEKLKTQVIDLTHSQFAIPLLDRFFEAPILKSSSLQGKLMPSKPMVMNMIGRLKKAGILKTVSPGSGRRAQVLALADLVNLCEGRKII